MKLMGHKKNSTPPHPHTHSLHTSCRKTAVRKWILFLSLIIARRAAIFFYFFLDFDSFKVKKRGAEREKKEASLFFLFYQEAFFDFNCWNSSLYFSSFLVKYSSLFTFRSNQLFKGKSLVVNSSLKFNFGLYFFWVFVYLFKWSLRIEVECYSCGSCSFFFSFFFSFSVFVNLQSGNWFIALWFVWKVFIMFLHKFCFFW